MSYSIPNVSHSPCNGFVHTRDLGQKSVDSGMYPDAPWSEVVLNNVPIELTIDLLNQDWNIQKSMETKDIHETITVGDRTLDDSIRVSETFRMEQEYEPRSSPGHRGSHRIKILRDNKFIVKPRNMEKRDRKDKYFKYNL